MADPFQAASYTRANLLLKKENAMLTEALRAIAIGSGDKVLSQEEMRARAFDALELQKEWAQ